MDKNNEELVSIVRQMLGSSATIAQLNGGINNFVYLASNSNDQVVIKKYPNLKKACRDRYHAEKKFLEYSNALSNKYTPKLIGSCEELRINIIEYISGKSFFVKNKILDSHIEQACDFIKSINEDADKMTDYISFYAADGGRSVQQHIENIERRINNFGVEHLPKRFKGKSISILKEVEEVIEVLKNWIHHPYNSLHKNIICAEKQMILSPSDFGFHNAILDLSGNIKFIDFEHSGLDDPAKLVLDFEYQPRMAITKKQAQKFCDEISMLQKSNVAEFKERARVLRRVLLLKWVVIILAVLDPERHQEITSGRDFDENFIPNRLQAAKDYIKLLNNMTDCSYG